MKQIAVFFCLLLAFAPLPGLAADLPPSAEANQAYLADFAKKSGVTTLPSGLLFRVLKSGIGKRPTPTDTVQLSYSGRLINGAVFDGTSPGLPVTVPLSNIIHGLGEALLRMHEGDRWQLVVPPNLAYGDKGSTNGTVPPGQALVFDVTLLAAIPVPVAASQGLTDSVTIRSADAQHGAVLTIHP